MPAGVVISWAVAVWWVLSVPPAFLDLTVYRAGGHAWSSGISLYGPEFPRLITMLPLPFTYPPISAVAFVVWLTARHLEADRWRAVQLASVAVVLGTVIEPVVETLSFGQVNLLLMAMIAADCLLPRTRWPRGMLIGLAAAIKLTPAVFVLFFLAHRQWRPVLAAGAAFAVATAVGFVAAPRDSVTYWFGGVLLDPGRIGSPAFPSNQSLSGVLHRWLVPPPWHTVLWLLGVAVVLVAAWVAVRRLRERGQDVAALLAVAAAGLLASPVSWSHHYVWAVPALIWCAHRALRAPRWWAAVAGLGAVVLVGPHWLVSTRTDHLPHWGFGAQLVGNAYVWVAIVALAVAVFGRLQRADSAPDSAASLAIQP